MSLRALFSSIADAIRYVIGGSNKIVASNFPNEIRAIKDNMQEVEIVPSTEDQIKEGIFSKVTVEGSTNLVPENIKKDVEIFGVKGNAVVSDLILIDGYQLFGGNHRLDDMQKFLNICSGIIECTEAMFYGCTSLTTLDLSNFDTSKVTNMSSMFYGCTKLSALDLSTLDTSNVTNMSNMFYDCDLLRTLDLSNFDTSNVTDMSGMFEDCGVRNLNLSSFNTSKVTNMGRMFFSGCYFAKLDLSHFDTSNVTNMSVMFNASTVTELNVSNWDTSKVVDMSGMFRSCTKLTSLLGLNNFDTSNVTDVSSMFDQIPLSDLDLSSFDFSKVISVRSIFMNGSKIVNVNSFKNLGKGYIQKSNNYSNYELSLSSCRNLTYESLMDFINNLYDLNLTYDVANGGTLYTQKLVLGSTNLAKLTADEIAIATNKGWNVS